MKGGPREVLGVPAFAEKFGVSEDTVRRWCREGKIPGAEQDGKGRPWRIPDDAVPPTKFINESE